MKIVFLGTNAWIDSNTGNTVSVLIDTKKYYVILDAGFGIRKASKYIKTSKPVYLFLSHMHIDHICGLHGLSGFYPKQGITIIGQKGTKKYLKTIFRSPFSEDLFRLPTQVKVKEVRPGKHSRPFEFECRKINHVDYTLGYRLHLDKKIISYCSDTGTSKNVVALSKNADVLIHECSLCPGEFLEKWGHASPNTAAKAAKHAKAKNLILTHFDPHLYKTEKSREKAKRAASKIFKSTLCAYDDLVLEI